MIVIRANTPDQVLEQTILSLLQQAQIEAEQITFCAKKKLELPGLVIDNTRHEISANGRNISLTRLESDLLWVLAVCEGTTLSKKELFDAVWGKDCADTLKVLAMPFPISERSWHSAGWTDVFAQLVEGMLFVTFWQSREKPIPILSRQWYPVAQRS